MYRSWQTIIRAASLSLLVVLTACGGGGNLLNSQPGSPASHNTFSANLLPSATTAGGPLAVTLEQQPNQVLLRVSSPGELTLPALFVAVDYDATRYTPVAVQATGNFTPLSNSLTLEMLQAPGHLEFGQVPAGKATGTLRAGEAVLEVLFNTSAFQAPKSVRNAPSGDNSISPLLWDDANSALKWFYVNPGDYDQNSEVGITDLAPLGQHLNEAGPFPFDTELSVIDGVADGVINISDLTPIGANYGNRVDAYNVYFSPDVSDVPQSYDMPSSLAPLATLSFSEAQGDPAQDRLYFSYVPEAGQQFGYYWVRPVADGQEGTPSEGARSNLNTGSADDNPPPPSQANGFNVAPEALLTLTMQNTHAPLSVVLDASASIDPDGTLVNFDWDFDGDGLFDSWSTDSQVLHVYSQPGTYSPRVRVQDDNGAFDTFAAPPFTVTALEVSNIAPTADIALTTLSGQAPLTVGLLATGSRDVDGSLAQFEWDFDGDGSFDLDSGTDPTVLHVYDMPGTYQVTVRVTDNRGDQATDSIPLSVSQVATNQLPQADLQANTVTGTAPLAVEFDGTGSSDSDGSLVDYAWDLDGDGAYEESGPQPTLSDTYSTPGVYDAKLRVTDNSGGTAVALLTITVNVAGNDLPLASLAADHTGGFAPLNVTLDGSASLDPDGSIVRYDYDFDNDGIWDSYDGGTSASHTYSAPGIFTARLRVTDNQGAQAVASLEIQTNAVGFTPPQAVLDASPLSGNAPLLVGLDGSGSSDGDGPLVRYDFDFNGDGIWDAYDAPSFTSFTYTSAGSYTARLRVTDGQGAQAIATQVISVNVVGNLAPQADLEATPENGNAPLTVSFDASGSADLDGTIARYDFDFNGDGIWDAYDGPVNPSWTFPSAGTFTALLRVTDDDGAQATATAEIEVSTLGNVAPTADLAATPSSGTAPLAVSFDASGSSDSDGTLMRYDYDFNNDGIWDAYDAGSSVSWTYNSPGNFDAVVRVTDSDWAQDETSVLVSVTAAGNVAPNAAIVPDLLVGNAPVLITFDCSSSNDPDGSIVRYDYDFNNDSVWDAYDSPSVIGHVFTADGSYLTKVRVTDNQGAQDIASVTITVNGGGGNGGPTAVVSATPQNFSVVPQNVVLDPSGSTAGGNPISRYDWDLDNDGFFDLYSGSPVNINRNITVVGVYTYKLRVTDTAGQFDEATIAVTASGPPVANLVVTPGNPVGVGTVLTLDASGSYDPGGSITKYEFDLDGNGSYEVNNLLVPTTTTSFANAGDFTVRVRVTDNDTNTSVTSQLVQVRVADIFTIDNQNGAGYFVGLAIVGGNPAMVWKRNTTSDVMYARATNASGSSWGAPVTVAATGVVGSYVDLVVADGRPAVVYGDNNSDLHYLRAEDANGTTWVQSNAITLDAGSTYSYSLAIIDGNPAVAYAESAGLKYVRASDAAGSAWNAIQLANTGGTNPGSDPSLAEVNGMPAIAFWSWNSDAGVRYRRASNVNGTAWNAIVTISANVTVNDSAITPSLAVVNGNPAVSFKIRADSTLRFARATDANGTAFGSAVVLYNDGNLNSVTNKLAQINGLPYLAFQDNNNNTLRLVAGTDANGAAWGTSQLIDSGPNGAGWAIDMLAIGTKPGIAYDATDAVDEARFALVY